MSNTQVLKIVLGKREYCCLPLDRGGKHTGHVIRHNLLIINTMEGRIKGRTGRARPSETFIGEMVEISGCNGYSHNEYSGINAIRFSLRQGLSFSK